MKIIPCLVFVSLACSSTPGGTGSGSAGSLVGSRGVPPALSGGDANGSSSVGGSGGLGEREPASWYETRAYCDGNSALVLCTGRVAVPTFLEGGGGLGPGGAGAVPMLEASG